MVVKRKSSLEVMNLHPMLYPMMQLVMFFHWFRYVLDWFWSIESYGMSTILGLVVGFGIKTVLWIRRSRETIGEEDNGRFWIEIMYFLFHFFSCVISGTYFTKF
jgi:hypothetical protein